MFGFQMFLFQFINFMMKKICFFLVLVIVCFSVVVVVVMNNNDVIKMVKVEFDDEIVIFVINVVKIIEFDIFVNGLVELKNKGVSQLVI